MTEPTAVRILRDYEEWANRRLEEGLDSSIDAFIAETSQIAYRDALEQIREIAIGNKGGGWGAIIALAERALEADEPKGLAA